MSRPVALQVLQPDSAEQHLHYRFFPTHGEVCLDGRQLIYHPERGGAQSILIFALDSGLGAFRQELRLNVS